MISVNLEKQCVNLGINYIYHAMNFRENEHVIFFEYNNKNYLITESGYENLLGEVDRVVEGFIGQLMTPETINTINNDVDQIIRTRCIEDTFNQGNRLLAAKKSKIDEEEIYELANEYFTRRFGRPIQNLEEWKQINNCLTRFEEFKNEYN